MFLRNVSLSFYLVACALGFGNPADAQTTKTTAPAKIEFHVGDPGREDRRAMPEARCIWNANYTRTRDFVLRMEHGIEATALEAELRAIALPCSSARANPRGNILSAIIQIRYPQVAECIKAIAPREFRDFRKRFKRAQPYDPGVLSFIHDGFPIPLADAARSCDAKLVAPIGMEERNSFWEDVLQQARPRND